jgi:hypothetical protein
MYTYLTSECLPLLWLNHLFSLLLLLLGPIKRGAMFDDFLTLSCSLFGHLLVICVLIDYELGALVGEDGILLLRLTAAHGSKKEGGGTIRGARVGFTGSSVTTCLAWPFQLSRPIYP